MSRHQQQQQRPYSTLHSPDQPQTSQYSLHTPITPTAPSPSSHTQSFHYPPPTTMQTPQYASEQMPAAPVPSPGPGYTQMQDLPPRTHYPASSNNNDVPAYDPRSQIPPPSPGFLPPPRFESPHPVPVGIMTPPPPSTGAPAYHSPPQSPTFAPPPTAEQYSAPTPQPQPQPQRRASGPPVPPAPIHTPAYNPTLDSNSPQTPKTPAYTPGGSSGPNGGVHAPGQIGHPNQQHGPEEYHHGLCDCFSDISTCCTGYWCPCILYSRTTHRLQTVPNSNISNFSSINPPCLIFCALAPVSWVMTLLQRSKIRENYKLEGGVASDCVKAYCCVSCMLVQDDREVRDREDERRRWAGPGSGVVGDGGYKRQETMVYGKD